MIETTNPSAALAFAQKSRATRRPTQTSQTYNGATYRLQEPVRPGLRHRRRLPRLRQPRAGSRPRSTRQRRLARRLERLQGLARRPPRTTGSGPSTPSPRPHRRDRQPVRRRRARRAREAPAGDLLEKPVAGALTASANSFDLEVDRRQPGVDTPESSLLGDVPGAGLARARHRQPRGQRQEEPRPAQGPDPQLRARSSSRSSRPPASSLDELTGALGDAVLYVQGTTESTLTGALVVQSKDPDLTGRLLNQLQGLLQLGGAIKPLQLSGGGTGFQMSDQSIPKPIEIAQQGDKLVIGYGPGSAEASLTPAQTLADSPAVHPGARPDLLARHGSSSSTCSRSSRWRSPPARSPIPATSRRSHIWTRSATLSPARASSGDKADFKAVLGLK